MTPTETQPLVASYQNHEHQAVYTQYAGRQDPGIFVYRYFYSENPNNFARLDDPEVDRLVSEPQRMVNQEARERLYVEFGDRTAELIPYAFVHNLNAAYIARAEVGGIDLVPDEVIRPAGLWVADSA